MGLLIFGIIILVIGLTLQKDALPLGKFKSLISTIGVVIMVLGLLTTTIKVVDAGHIGVKKLFGEVQSDVLNEGLNFVNPFIDVLVLSTQTQNYTMSSTSSEGEKAGDDAVSVLSKDGLQVIIDLTVLYKTKAEDAPQIIKKIGQDFKDKIIRPIVRSQIRESAVDYTAIELYSEQRGGFEKQVKDAISATLNERGFELEDMLVRKIDLPMSVKQSIERKITAIQEDQRMVYVLEKEIKEAQRKREEAAGVADAQKIINSGLSNKLIEFERIKVMQELVKSSNSKVIVLGNGDTPIILDGK
ncbi:MAG: band 7 protein [Ignavibacteriae bacterium HGW-Ignavibacteriae-4]|jgi:regulator of protease activity HflC (stomatin/prohibitin superfamily)|nr:MAG: band 7 protein [Ignavibacteriae bacterium HGW-Ignavibacteriae-4]